MLSWHNIDDEQEFSLIPFSDQKPLVASIGLLMRGAQLTGRVKSMAAFTCVVPSIAMTSISKLIEEPVAAIQLENVAVSMQS